MFNYFNSYFATQINCSSLLFVPLRRDAVVVCSLNTLAITIIGLIMFSTLGYLSQERNLPITEVIVNGNLILFPTLIQVYTFSFAIKHLSGGYHLVVW